MAVMVLAIAMPAATTPHAATLSTRALYGHRTMRHLRLDNGRCSGPTASAAETVSIAPEYAKVLALVTDRLYAPPI